VCDEVQVFSKILEYCSYSSAGPLGENEAEIVDDNGEAHVFKFETFYNTYEALTLGYRVRRKEAIISLPVKRILEPTSPLIGEVLRSGRNR
jgi:hypothetical protein